MRSRGGILVALGALFAALAAGAAPASVHRQLPRLRLVSMSPVTIAGTHFVKRERVKVRFGTVVRLVKTDATGSFVIRIVGVSFDRCNGGIIITAAGVQGDEAALKFAGMACPPAATPAPPSP